VLIAAGTQLHRITVPMTTLRFGYDNARWLAAGMLLTWSSSFGQTFFIALSAGDLRETFNLSHGEWGGLYTMGTFLSAVALIQAGSLADRLRVRTLALYVLAGYVVMCLAMALVFHWVMLVFVIFGLRFCGQGMMSHLALTAMARWFRAQRGRAVAIASWGFALGQGTWPLLFVFLSASLGWRETWVLASLVLALVTAPLTFALLRQERTPQSFEEKQDSPGMDGRHWTRREALGHWLIWALLPGLMAPSFMVTSVFFHQVHLVGIKGWSLGSYVALYPCYSLLTVVTNMACGIMIDRFGSARVLPFYLLPLAAGLVVLSQSSSFWLAPVALALIGLTQGCSQSLIGSIWPEYFGTRHLGAIRALVVSTLVLGSALGPGVSGWLIDLGYGLEPQLLCMSAYLIIISILFVLVGRAAGRDRESSAMR
jgi:MFS family permease